jgi:acylphosphatase
MRNEQNERLHTFVEGIVQGVGFRFYIYQTGSKLQLYGWVRNRINGSVEILAEGSREKLNALLQETRKGPQMAKIIRVDVEWEKPRNDLPPFTILQTK